MDSRAPAGTSDIRELQDYIDAQDGGPGKGWFRIVTTPVRGAPGHQRGQARGRPRASRSPSSSTAASTTSRPSATRRQIDRRLDEVYDLGVRDMELVNKFDNALGGRRGRQRRRPASSSTPATSSRPASSGRCRPATAAADVQDREQLTAARRRRATRWSATSCDTFGPAGTAAGLPAGAALQRARPHLARRAPRQADDRQAR